MTDNRIVNNKGLSYDDVLLIPKYSNIESRSEIDLSVNLGNSLNLEMPVFSSPMDTVSETAMAVAMDKHGGSAVVHRYNDIEQQATLVSNAVEKARHNVGFAVGIKGDYLERALAGVEAGASFICVDVAHGHHILMKRALGRLRTLIGENFHIMAGNVATLAGVNDLADWGADSVRCNIGGGSICSTRVQTGHGVPGLQTIFECARTDRDVAIIADGGIRNSGDIVKALAAGADAVMCGSLFSGTTETPGNVMTDMNGTKWKTYRGMASKEAQVEWRGNYSSFEGVSARVPYRGRMHDVLANIEKGIRSGLSYSGARTIKELQSLSEFMIQTSAGQNESGTHINHRSW